MNPNSAPACVSRQCTSSRSEDPHSVALSSETCSGVQCKWDSAERGTLWATASKDPHLPARVQHSRVKISQRGLGASHGRCGPSRRVCLAHSLGYTQSLPCNSCLSQSDSSGSNLTPSKMKVVEECTCSAVQRQLRLRLGCQPEFSPCLRVQAVQIITVGSSFSGTVIRDMFRCTVPMGFR